MANTHFLSKDGLSYFFNQIKLMFAGKGEFDALSDRVDDIVTEGGEPNVIETVSVNGSNVPPVNKNIALSIPTKVSDLSNDSNFATVSQIPTKVSDLTNDSGYATASQIPTKVSDLTNDSGYATTSYVDQHGGKIDVIEVNGTAQTITNKTVDISVPVKVSDLTNDSQYQTASQVSTAINAAITSVYRWKGSVATTANLPASGNTVGDVYDVQATGSNYAWTGSAWDALGQMVDTSLLWAKSELTAMTDAQVDAIFA